MSHPVTSPSIIPKSVSGSPPRSPISWCGIPDPPYAIRNSEFGNRDSETGDSGNHGAVEWAIHPPAPPRTPIRGFSFLSVRYPRNERAFTSTIKRAPSPLSAPAINIHPSLPNWYFAISGRVFKNRSRSVGAVRAPCKALRRSRFLTPLLEGV